MVEPRFQNSKNGVEKTKMDVAMMQPSFMPWLGFFGLILHSDQFICLDDFQFSVQSYHQRNRLFVNKGQVDWYTVPVQKGSFKAPLNQVKINEVIPWRKKFWNRIQQNYSKAPNYTLIAPFLERWLSTTAESLAAQNISFIKVICELMNFKGEFKLSSQMPSNANRSVRVHELLLCSNASRYLCANGSFSYMLDDGVFPVENLEILFQDFKQSSYEQIGAVGDFVPFLSVIDALMNVGTEATREIIEKGTVKWKSWGEKVREIENED